MEEKKFRKKSKEKSVFQYNHCLCSCKCFVYAKCKAFLLLFCVNKINKEELINSLGKTSLNKH